MVSCTIPSWTCMDHQAARPLVSEPLAGRALDKPAGQLEKDHISSCIPSQKALASTKQLGSAVVSLARQGSFGKSKIMELKQNDLM